MDRHDLMNLASRVAHAPSYEARVGELVRLAPESMLNRYGLTHQTSWMGSFFAFTGAFVIGAGIGAGTALLLAPTSGEELRGSFRSRAQRIGSDVKDATNKAEEKVVQARERVISRVAPAKAYDSTTDNGIGGSPSRTGY